MCVCVCVCVRVWVSSETCRDRLSRDPRCKEGRQSSHAINTKDLSGRRTAMSVTTARNQPTEGACHPLSPGVCVCVCVFICRTVQNNVQRFPIIRTAKSAEPFCCCLQYSCCYCTQLLNRCHDEGTGDEIKLKLCFV